MIFPDVKNEWGSPFLPVEEKSTFVVLGRWDTLSEPWLSHLCQQC